MRSKYFSITLILLSSLVIYCSSFVTKVNREDLGSENIALSGIQMTSGEYIQFHRAILGKIEDDSVTYTKIKTRETVIPRDSIAAIQHGVDGRINLILLQDSTKVYVASYREETDRLILTRRVQEKVAIPLSEIEFVNIRDAHKRKAETAVGITLGLVLGGAGLVLLFSLLLGLMLRGAFGE
jgi:hypothetical protein